MLNVENITKNFEMLKNVGTKINFSTQIILFFDKEFKKIIIVLFLPTFILISTYNNFCAILWSILPQELPIKSYYDFKLMYIQNKFINYCYQYL